MVKANLFPLKWTPEFVGGFRSEIFWRQKERIMIVCTGDLTGEGRVFVRLTGMASTRGIMGQDFVEERLSDESSPMLRRSRKYVFEREREKERESVRDWRTERKTDRPTETKKKSDRVRGWVSEWVSVKQTIKETDRGRQRQTDRKRQTEKDSV